ncbi:hypothetical protein [Leisingera methylohalidivorans]|uniref:Uncharacterized protein n=1 Tax=Leisingera methylohalidivorans DSM 14336 TaxID=999552 RepID=V9VRK4_9RHOB|nr:hypothetical protein [Leisingera methylohalidivorans]AHD01371.1 hypothetical protein METH_12400 [Leisingera methylohalidivorans DSM 14336]
MPETPSPAAGYSFSRRGRSPAAMLATGVWLAVLLLLWLLLDAAVLLVILLALPVVPALLDLIRNPLSGLMLSGNRIEWFTGGLTGKAELGEIDRVRFDTRWDFSVRATLILRSGKRIRLPQEATPPHAEADAAFQARGIKTERHHFTAF